MELKNITKNYDNKIIFNDFTYKFSDSDITVILGESGVGKTTLLNIIAGLVEYSGEVEKKATSYVFQEDRLIPNLSVSENIRFLNNSADVSFYLNELGLGDIGDMYPNKLSAGMMRRVAIARALAYTADIYLMDEPFVNLDYVLKYKLMDFVKNFHKFNKKGIIIVTHDIDVATYLADKILILGNGRIEKVISKITKNTRDKILQFLLNK